MSAGAPVCSSLQGETRPERQLLLALCCQVELCGRVGVLSGHGNNVCEVVEQVFPPTHPFGRAIAL